MSTGWRSFVLGGSVAVVGCGPAAPDVDHAGTTSGHEGSAGSAGEVTSGSPSTTGDAGLETAADTTLASDTTSLADTGTSGESLGCEMHDPAACPDGCMRVMGYPSTGADLDQGAGRPLCIAIGDALTTGYSSAWWAVIDGEALFVLSHQSCLGHVSAQPAEWTECSGAPGEPDLCALLCAQDVCPGELDAMELQGCDVPTACSPAVFDGFCGPTAEIACVHASLRDRVPGRYTIEFPWSNMSWEWLLVVSDDGSVQATVLDVTGLGCTSAFTAGWHPAQHCQLAEPELFDSCIDATSVCGDGSDCMPAPETLAPWLVDCVQMPAACP